MERFSNDFYKKCNEQRIYFLKNKFGDDYFKSKTVLDLGGGVGYISNELSKLGADCTVYEGREENINIGKNKFPHIKFIKVDLEDQIPIDKFDIVLNFGVFYHLKNPENFLIKTSSLFNDMMLLDGNVSTNGSRYQMDNPDDYDQSIHGEIKLVTDDDISYLFKNFNIENVNIELNEIGKITGSPYDYVNGCDFLSDNNMKRTFWIIENIT